jgi:hypothetical protein
LPIIIDEAGNLIDTKVSGGTAETGIKTIGTGTFVDDKKSVSKLPVAPVSKNLKPYVLALGGIVAILIVSRMISKK